LEQLVFNDYFLDFNDKTKSIDERYDAGFGAALLLLVDENNEPLLKEEDRAAVKKASATPLLRVFTTGLRGYETAKKKLIEGDRNLLTIVKIAFILKKSIREVAAFPLWERDLWRAIFEIYGPLDWQRDDLRTAQLISLQLTERRDLEDLTVYPNPARVLEKERARQAMSKEDALALFGVKES
jgi:hypothetical protein